MQEQKPTVGRIVHYQAYGTPGGEFKSVPRAAIVTDVHADNEVTVCVEPTAGCWNWPPRS